MNCKIDSFFLQKENLRTIKRKIFNIDFYILEKHKNKENKENKEVNNITNFKVKNKKKYKINKTYDTINNEK